MNQENLILSIQEIQKESGTKIDIDSLKSLLAKIINGDSFVEGIARPATLEKDKKGILVYVLTTSKLAEIQINNNEIHSSSKYLKQISGIERGISKGEDGENRSEVLIDFPQESMGARYDETDKEVDSFFSRVEQQFRELK